MLFSILLCFICLFHTEATNALSFFDYGTLLYPAVCQSSIYMGVEQTTVLSRFDNSLIPFMILICSHIYNKMHTSAAVCQVSNYNSTGVWYNPILLCGYQFWVFGFYRRCDSGVFFYNLFFLLREFLFAFHLRLVSLYLSTFQNA